MLTSFCRYFFKYIFFSKTRQGALLLAFAGPFLSALALLSLQSFMEGLQHSQIQRSQKIVGRAEIIFPQGIPLKEAQQLQARLQGLGIDNDPELQLELLLKAGRRLAPVLAHGVGPEGLPFEGPREFEIIVPFAMAHKLGLEVGEKIQLISPAHVDIFFEEIPRSTSLFVSDFVRSRVPEVDALHVWAYRNFLFRLVGSAMSNRLIIRSPVSPRAVERALQDFPHPWSLKTWEEKHESLVFALNLESSVMLFLFVAMNLLVSLCVASGLLVFFRKIRPDLASFWILGGPKEGLHRAALSLMNALALGAATSGVVAGLIFLGLFKAFVGDIMPDIFVDRTIPVQITPQAVAVSLAIPYTLFLAISWPMLRSFKRESHYLEVVRAMG